MLLKRIGSLVIGAALMALSAGCGGTDRAMPAAVEGFDTPECALFDPDTAAIYVSNMAGTPDEYWADDGKGFISRLHADGRVDQMKWIESRPESPMHSPKGMCILHGTLYVADNTRVLAFSLADGAPVGVIAVEGAEKLNDMASDGQYVYVSDTSAGRIIRLDLSGTGAHEVVAELAAANGLAFHGKEMYAVSWDLHELYVIDRTGGQPPQPFGLAEHFTHLDGLEVLADGRFVVTDFTGNKVSVVSADRKTVTTVAELENPADCGIDRKNGRLFLPQLTKNRLARIPLP